MTTAEIGGMHYYCCYRIDFEASNFSTHASRLGKLCAMEVTAAVTSKRPLLSQLEGEDILRGMNKASAIHLCTSKA
jgi:hypothetical protein